MRPENEKRFVKNGSRKENHLTIFWSSCVIWFALAITALKSAPTKLFEIKSSKALSMGIQSSNCLENESLLWSLDKAMSISCAHESAKHLRADIKDLVFDRASVRHKVLERKPCPYHVRARQKTISQSARSAVDVVVPCIRTSEIVQPKGRLV